MPETIGALLLTFVVNSPIYFLGPAAVSAVASGLGYAAFAGVGLLAQSLLREKPPKPEDVQVNTRQATPARTGLYGQGKLGGPFLFRETKDAVLHEVIALASRELSSIEEFWIDDKVVTLTGADGNVQTEPWKDGTDSFCYIDHRLGTASQTPFLTLTTHFPTKVTADHQGNGIAMLNTYMITPPPDNVADVWPNGANTLFRVVARGCRVYDPTDETQDSPATWTWSDNLARIILDYMWHADGMRIPVGFLLTPLALAGWQQAVEDCDDLIALKAGGTENRYRLWGSYAYNERPGDVLRRFMMAGNARLKPTPDGGVHIEVGKWNAPTVSLDETAITGLQNFGRGKSIMETANVITAQYTSAPHDYQATDADPWVDDVDVAERGEITAGVEFLCSPSHGQTRRLMKIEAHRANPDFSGTLFFNLKALPAYGERFIHLTWDAFGVDHDFEVLDFQFIFGEHSTLIGVSMQLQSISEDAYSWDAATEEGTAPVPDSTTDDSVTPVPTGLVATLFRKSVAGASVAFAKLTVDAAPRPSLTLQMQGKKTSDTTWLPITVSPGATEAESFALEDGEEYEFQARYFGGAWTTSVEVDVTEIGATYDFSLSSNSQFLFDV